MKKTKILVVALQGLGNLVMALPSLAMLGGRDGAEVHVLVPNKAFACLLDGNTQVAGVIETQGRNLIQLILHLRRMSFDGIVLSFPSGPRSTLLAAACGAPVRVAISARRNQSFRFLLTRALPYEPDTHDINANRQLVRAACDTLGLKCGADAPGPWIHLSKDECRLADDWFSERNITADDVIVGIAPGSGKNQPFKRWPLGYFREVCDSLTAHNGDLKYLWIVGPDEVDLLMVLEQWGLSEQHVIVAGTTLRQTLCLLDRCSAVVSNDNGLMHMASAMGVGVVALFGPTDERRNGPSGSESIVVAGELPCRPCYSFNEHEFSCSQETEFACLESGMVGRVVQSTLSILEISPEAE